MFLAGYFNSQLKHFKGQIVGRFERQAGQAPLEDAIKYGTELTWKSNGPDLHVTARDAAERSYNQPGTAPLSVGSRAGLRTPVWWFCLLPELSSRVDLSPWI